MISKKAQQSTIVGLIIVLLVGIFLIIFIRGIVDVDTSRDLCLASVVKKAETKIVGKPTTSYLKCEPNYIKIDRKGIYLNDKKDISFDGTKSRSEEQIKSYLANQMYDCWYQFGQGKVDFLSDYAWPATIDLRCFPCAYVDFEAEFLKDFTFEEWESYLSDTEYQPGKSYMDFLSNSGRLYPESYLKKSLGQSEGGQLSIYLFGAKKIAWASDNPLSAIFYLSPVSVIRTEFQSRTQLVDSKDIPSICTMLY